MNEKRQYNSEYAKSGRSSCKDCSKKIANEELRLGIFVAVCIYFSL